MNVAQRNIVYLYSEVMPYVITVMKAVRDNFNANIHCVNWDKNKKTPFIPSDLDRIHFYKRSAFNRETLFEFIETRKPDMIFVSGRMDKLYLEAATHYKAKGVPIISACDNQWIGTYKNRIASLLGKQLYRKYFDYLWVPGKRQFEFGKRIGYENSALIEGLYCADVDVYKNIYLQKREMAKAYPRTIAFVGRFTAVKGIDLLIKAFLEAKKEVELPWKLVLVGAGDKQYDFNGKNDIVVKGFMSTDELAENSKEWGVFCLPSFQEPWGVVVHEFAAAGLPLICSDSVGAADAFVIENYNGYIFKNGSVASLKQKLVAMMQKTDDELWQMADRSTGMADVITPIKSAHNFISVLSKEKIRDTY